jgi:Rrf2 family protein
VIAFTRKTDYALIALASLAQEAAAQGEGTPEAAPQSARAIAQRYSVPLPILMNVLKDLTGASLVRSTRGVRGGYALARPPRHITVHDVVEAIEGKPSLAICCDDGTAEADACPECGVELRCPVTHSVRRLNERINRFLHEVTLADLLEGGRGASSVVPVTTLRRSIERSPRSAGGSR